MNDDVINNEIAKYTRLRLLLRKTVFTKKSANVNKW